MAVGVRGICLNTRWASQDSWTARMSAFLPAGVWCMGRFLFPESSRSALMRHTHGVAPVTRLVLSQGPGGRGGSTDDSRRPAVYGIPYAGASRKEP